MPRVACCSCSTRNASPYLWDPLPRSPPLIRRSCRRTPGRDRGRRRGRRRGTNDGKRGRLRQSTSPPPPDAEAVIDHLLRTLAASAGRETSWRRRRRRMPVLGEVTVGFDGTTCSYERSIDAARPGPTEVSTAGGATEYITAVVHLVAGATVDEVLTWVAEHPTRTHRWSTTSGWSEVGASPHRRRSSSGRGPWPLRAAPRTAAIHVAGTVEVSG